MQKNSKEIFEVCVFDLDGTLWEVNSHVDIVEKYKGVRLYSSVWGKLLYKSCPKVYMCLLNRDYKKIPIKYISNYQPKFREDAIRFMNEKLAGNATVVIISNAPEEILEGVKERLNIETYNAPIGKKDEVLKRVFSKWSYLTVVTDNLSDASLIELADEAIIYTPKRRKTKFLGLKLPTKVLFKLS